jgi:membrane protein
LKGFGVQNRLEPLLQQQVAAGSEKAVSSLILYINNTNVASLGFVGLVALMFTALSLFDSIDEAFNDIWEVSETRSLYRKFTDYMYVALVVPLLMIAATSVTTILKSQDIIQNLVSVPYLGVFVTHGFGFTPYLSIWLALIFFYVFIPNTKVQLQSAILGGILAGTLWQFAQWCYIHFQVGVTKYNAIYGALSLVPLIMVWIYTSWVVVLFGGEVARAHQSLGSCRRGVRKSLSHAMHEYLVLSLFQMISTAFVFGRPARTAEDIADELDVPTRMVRDLCSFFVERRLLVNGSGDVPVFLPARDPESITVNELLAALKGYGGEGWQLMTDAMKPDVACLLERIEAQRRETLAGMTVKDLAVCPAIDKRPENGI